MTDNVIEQIKRAITQTALNFGQSVPVATDLAECAANKIMKSIGGSLYYIPKNNNVNERNKQIKEEFNGRNKRELCKKFAVSKSTIYRALNKK